MHLLDLLDRRSLLVVATLGVAGASYALWPCDAPASQLDEATSDLGKPSHCAPSVINAERDDIGHLHRAMQRRDALPDQITPACALVTLAGAEQTAGVTGAETIFFACDGSGCEPVAAPLAAQTFKHCDNGLPQQFLLRSEFQVSTWHQLWCDDLGSLATVTSAVVAVRNGRESGDDDAATRRMFACVPTVAAPDADLTQSNVAPSRLIRRSNRNVAAPVKLEALSR